MVYKTGSIKKFFNVICNWWVFVIGWLSIWLKKSSLYNKGGKTQFEMWAKLSVKLFKSGPSLQIRKIVLSLVNFIDLYHLNKNVMI